MNIKHIKIVVSGVLAVLFSMYASRSAAQDKTASDYSVMATVPKAVSSGSKLEYRSNILPYPTREEALERSAASAYIIPLSGWSRDTVPGGVRYSARFKLHYSWDDRAVILRIEDVSSSFSVEVNGRDAGYSQNCAGRSEFDITDLTVPDYNEVGITIYDEAAADRLSSGRTGGSPHFSAASVISQPAVRVHDIFVDTSSDDRFGYLTLEVVMQSILLNPKEYVVHYELLDPSGRTVAMSQKGLTVGMLGRDTVRFVARIPEPAKWNHESPNLYTLLVRSQNEGRFRENIAVKTGFRDVSHTGGRLLIDGLPVALYGFRYAANENPTLTADKLARLKEDGYNCIVVNGFPQPDYFYSLCDSLGLYVCDAADIDTSAAPQRITVGGNPSNDPLWRDAYIDRLHSMYYSSAIHPSVVMVSPARNSLNGYCLYESYMELKRIAPSVPVFYGEANGEWNNDLDSAYLFLKPRTKVSEGLVSIIIEREDDGSEVVFVNNMALSPARGTYKIEVKSGRKTMSSAAGEFDIEGGGQYRYPLTLPAGAMKKGSVKVEVSTLRNVQAEAGSGKSKVSDMYETRSMKFDL